MLKTVFNVSFVSLLLLPLFLGLLLAQITLILKTIYSFVCLGLAVFEKKSKTELTYFHKLQLTSTVLQIKLQDAEEKPELLGEEAHLFSLCHLTETVFTDSDCPQSGHVPSIHACSQHSQRAYCGAAPRLAQILT